MSRVEYRSVPFTPLLPFLRLFIVPRPSQADPIILFADSYHPSCPHRARSFTSPKSGRPRCRSRRLSRTSQSLFPSNLHSGSLPTSRFPQTATFSRRRTDFSSVLLLSLAEALRSNYFSPRRLLLRSLAEMTSTTPLTEDPIPTSELNTPFSLLSRCRNREANETLTFDASQLSPVLPLLFRPFFSPAPSRIFHRLDRVTSSYPTSATSST